MGILRGLIGFMFGLVFGGAALVALTIYMPQVGGVDTTAKVEAPVETVDGPVAEETQPVVVEERPKIATADPIVTEEQPEPVKPGGAVAKAEPAPEEPAKEPEATTPTIVWQSQQTDENTPEKTFNLPTITVDKPEVAINDPDVDSDSDTDTGIGVGKKPSSRIPAIATTPKVAEIKIAPEDASALELNATDYEATDRPLLGVILLDVGDKGLSIDKLKRLNAPFTIAIRIDAPDASARAMAYRAAGFEVIAMASDDRNAALNRALNSDQIETALDVMFTTVPDAIGLLDSSQAKIQKNSRTAKVILKAFLETGHGLITYDKGLNSVDREAHAAGVRTAKVARTLDANSENKALMVRYLDRVSLDARRDGAAIVLGTTAKETVATIAVWLLGTKGQSVSVAPASAVLLGR